MSRESVLRKYIDRRIHSEVYTRGTSHTGDVQARYTTFAILPKHPELVLDPYSRRLCLVFHPSKRSPFSAIFLWYHLFFDSNHFILLNFFLLSALLVFHRFFFLHFFIITIFCFFSFLGSAAFSSSFIRPRARILRGFLLIRWKPLCFPPPSSFPLLSNVFSPLPLDFFSLDSSTLGSFVLPLCYLTSITLFLTSP